MSAQRRRRALLRRRVAGTSVADEVPAGAAAPAEEENGNRPLTPGQQRMWSIQQLDPLTAGYNVTIALDITGDLAAEPLERALEQVVARHEILRTTYQLGEGGQVRQMVHEQLPARFDTCAVDDPARVGELARELAAEPFDLAKDTPLRVRLIETGPGTSTLVVVAHHIVWDDATTAVFFGELLGHYRGARLGEPRQYTELARAAERALTREDREAGVEYWRSALEPLPELLDLPGLSGGAGGAGSELSVPLRPGTGARVRELARREGASSFMVLFAAVSAVLHRYTGAREFLIGAPVVNRDLPGGDEAIGYLGNTIALRAEVDPAEDFRALLARCRATCVAAYTHQHVELDDVARAVDPHRTRGDAGLFNVVLSLRSPVFEPFRAAGLRAVRRHVPGSDARFDLTLAVETADGEDGNADLTVEANFPAGPRADAQAGLILEHLDRLLAAALADPATPVGELDLLGEGERERLLGEWNDTAAPAEQRTFPELFAERVAASPDATALLRLDGTALTYAEVAAWTHQLARYLVERGIGPGDTVALSVPRSAKMVVAALGVLAAGAAYVPVDPDYPADRVRFMLADSEPRLVLTTGEVLDRLPSGTPNLVALDDPSATERMAALSGAPLTDADRVAPLNPDHPAYLIYTSGSTGVPKGVVVAHRALSNHLDWALRRFVGLGGHTLMHSSISFDFTVTPMLGTLLAGGRLELCEDSPDAIAGANGAATFLKITPSHLPLLDAVRFAEDAERTLVIAGEALGGEALAGWRPPPTGRTDVINEYGPTEATVGCLLHEVDLPVPDGPVPVGYPVTNTTCHVLDASLRLVPVGVTGELYVGGVQLAQGYLGRPELTASRFVASPFGPPGERLYRTGDRVRRRPDGALEFLGRVDDQVKIRGFRVEPGEVEAVLVGHPSVAQAAVVARTDGPGGTYLAGYAVAAPGASVDGPALREHLAGLLPDHMVPAVIVGLDELPLSPSGKTDRRALPAPDFTPDRPAGREPASETERRLAELFGEVLGGREVGVTDSFFELGGDSILAIQLVSKARKAGLKLSPREVFEHRTVEALAAAIPESAPAPAAAASTGGASEELGEVEPSPIQRAFAERGALGDGHHMALLLDVPALSSEPLVAAVQAVLDRHAALRAVLHRTGPTPRLEVRPVGAVRAEAAVRRVDAGASVDDERAEAVARLDPAAGVLVQVVWFDGSPGRLLLVVHHLVVDGVSLRILAEDLSAAWRATSTGAKPELPAVGTPVRAWTAGLARRAPERSNELPRWRTVLDGPRPLLGSRPLDPARDTWASVRTHVQELDTATSQAVLTTVPNAFFAGPDDVLLAALGLALAGWRPELSDLPVLLEGHGREEAAVPGADLSRTVGWFTTQYPVRLDSTGLDLADALAGGEAAGAMIKRVKEHLRELPDHGIGYGMLRRLAAAPELAELPEPELGFNYLGRFSGRADGDWPVAPGGLSAAYDPAMPAPAVLVVNALCTDGPDGPRFTAHWMYASTVLDERQVSDLAQRWRDALGALARHAEGPGAGGHTPSDLPMVSLNQSQLDALEAKWRKP